MTDCHECLIFVAVTPQFEQAMAVTARQFKITVDEAAAEFLAQHHAAGHPNREQRRASAMRWWNERGRFLFRESDLRG